MTFEYMFTHDLIISQGYAPRGRGIIPERIKYKEAECYAQAYPYRDGTGEYSMVLPCLIELTKIRTKILKENYL